jgi:hypothetical protein
MVGRERLFRFEPCRRSTFDRVVRVRLGLERQQVHLERNAARRRESSDPSAGRNHAMTRNKNRKPVGRHDRPDGACRTGGAGPRRELSVRHRAPEGDLPGHPHNTSLKLRTGPSNDLNIVKGNSTPQPILEKSTLEQGKPVSFVEGRGFPLGGQAPRDRGTNLVFRRVSNPDSRHAKIGPQEPAPAECGRKNRQTRTIIDGNTPGEACFTALTSHLNPFTIPV